MRRKNRATKYSISADELAYADWHNTRKKINCLHNPSSVLSSFLFFVSIAVTRVVCQAKSSLLPSGNEPATPPPPSWYPSPSSLGCKMSTLGDLWNDLWHGAALQRVRMRGKKAAYANFSLLPCFIQAEKLNDNFVVVVMTFLPHQQMEPVCWTWNSTLPVSPIALSGLNWTWTVIAHFHINNWHFQNCNSTTDLDPPTVELWQYRFAVTRFLPLSLGCDTVLSLSLGCDTVLFISLDCD